MLRGKRLVPICLSVFAIVLILSAVFSLNGQAAFVEPARDDRVAAAYQTCPTPTGKGVRRDTGSTARLFSTMEDTYLFAGMPGWVIGGELTYLMLTEPQWDVKGRRTIVQLDTRMVQDMIPPGHLMVNAWLQFHPAKSYAPDEYLHIFRIVQDWDEYYADWDDRLYDTLWEANGMGAGEDYESCVSGRGSTDGWMDITDLVQGWLNDPDSNKGFFIMGPDDRVIQLSSSDSWNPYYRPILHMFTQCPTSNCP